MSPDKRIQDLQHAIRLRGLAGAVLFYSRDIFYYAGTAQPCYLVVLPSDYRLFVRRGWEFACRETFLPEGRIVREGNLASISRQMFPGTGEKIGAELDMLPVLQQRAISDALNNRELVDISPDILDQRMIKERSEIDKIRKACAVVHMGHLALMRGMRMGMSELEVAALVEDAHRRAGHEGMSFQRLVDFVVARGALTSGPNLRNTSGAVFTISGVGLSPAIPSGASRRVLEHGDLLMIDIPTCVEGYHADQSRTYAIGQYPDRSIELAHRLRDVADHLIHNLVPGITAGDAFSIAQDRASELGLEDSFLNFASQPKAHFVGHGVGLEINEPPILARNRSTPLAAGMVVAVEMHVMESDGLTVKLEDTVHIGSNGAEILTLSPRELSLLTPIN